MLVLDGGFGHLLKERGAGSFRAAALANIEQPALVQELHSEYLRAGADCITTNNFVAVPAVLDPISVPFTEAVAASARIAREAVDSSGLAHALVAGSLPPLGPTYDPAGAGTDPEALRETYKRIARELVPHCDVLLCETMSTLAEARAAAEAASAAGAPEIWVSFTLRDTYSDPRLRDGTPLATAAETLLSSRIPRVNGLLANCCAPFAADAAVPVLARSAESCPVRVGAYANGFRCTTDEWLAGGDEARPRATDPREYDADGVVSVEAYSAHAREWRRAGASVVGGCCGTSPAHTRALAEALRGEGEVQARTQR
mmetsp:Transcript_12364/g.40686  ORF Transcript_12364/g.40686 Transcript_12364/m.40686 type:complete len:315 (+) Transcript_12364:34-978(+)